MAVSSKVSDHAFAPYRGTEAQCQAYPASPGAIFFAYDTNKIYFDDANGNRHVMSGSGIKFVYGDHVGELDESEDPAYQGLFPYPKLDIEKAYDLMEKPVETYQTEDIIINSDGTFYRIKKITQEYAYVEKILVAGTGGGGGGSTDTLTLSQSTFFKSILAQGQDAVGVLKVVDTKRRGYVTLTFNFYDNDQAIEPYHEAWIKSNIQLSQTTSTNFVPITIPASEFKTGNTLLKVQARINETVSETLWIYIQVVDVHFVPTPQWRPDLYHYSTDTTFEFPYQITLGGGLTQTSLFNSAELHANVVIDGTISPSEPWDLKNMPGQQLGLTGILPIRDLFLNNGLKHGAHTLDVIATMVMNDQEITISDNLHYEISWREPNDSEHPTRPIIIWSPFARTGVEYKNYSVINIPFMVLDADQPTREVEVTYYINDEEISTESLVYRTTGYYEWEISKYNLGTNTFSIVSGDVIWQTIVNIVPEVGYTLEPIEGSDLYLTAQGRSNNESALKRQTWKNEISTSRYTTGDVVLSGFNWYNNGWVKETLTQEEIAEGKTPATVLRVSNGASVYIPMNLFATGNVGQTYEFEFAVHNAVDYSRLIANETVYVKYQDMLDGTSLHWAGKDEDPESPTYGDAILEPYDSSLFEADSDGYAVYREDGDGWQRGDKIPAENPLTGDDIMQHVALSDDTSAFLTYYASNMGIVLGTQEAYLALSKTTLVSARYTDNQRVKLSFVIEPNGSQSMIYAYINGVLTSVLEYNAASISLGSQDFSQSDKSEGITITSVCGDIDIYAIRTYGSPLDFAQIGRNWTASGTTIAEKKSRYKINQYILNDNQTGISYDKIRMLQALPRDDEFYSEEIMNMPLMVISSFDYPLLKGVNNRLPYKKGDKLGVNIRYFDPKSHDTTSSKCKSFHAANVVINVQGTSSQGYPRRNYSFKLKAGSSDWEDPVKIAAQGYDIEANPFRIEAWDGVEANKNIYSVDKMKKAKWDIGNGIKAAEFCLKADYMDSSSTHNTAGAMLMAQLAGQAGGYDLRHPLDRLLNTSTGYRTTVFGFPILLFWEKADGSINYLGKFNFNIHKGSENTFGFTDPTTQPYYQDETVHLEEVEDEETHETSQVKMMTIKQYNEELDTFEDVDVPCDYEHITECWEIRNNQAGPSKFTFGVNDRWDATVPFVTASGQTLNYYEIEKHFEQRYPEMETANYEGEANMGNATEWMQRTKNFKKLWEWIRSTDVTSYAYGASDRGINEITEPVYYKTLSDTYEEEVTYYSYDSANATYSPVEIHKERTAVLKHAYNKTTGFTYNDEGQITDTDIKDITKMYFVSPNGVETFWNKLKEINNDTNGADSQYVGEQTLSYDRTSGKWMYGSIEIDNLEDEFGFYIDPTLTAPVYLVFTLSVETVGFSTDLYEKFEDDTNRYRLCKFKNEIRKHLNFDYTIFYFLMTEFFLMYDSRQKNMMIASWGPEEQNGDFIWYPIFYDLDTQLGINNSGQVYWDYDTDATPPLSTRTVVRTIGNRSVVDVDIYSPTGSTDSIFSGNGSVLWNNMQLCFNTDIINMYKVLREDFHFDEELLYTLFEKNSSNKWSPTMKNFDQYYKYLLPAITGVSKYGDAGGYVTQKNTIGYTNLYYYCLQGDRSLQRIAMLRNRFNYLDSEWSAASYDASKTSTQIKMRYNLNDKDRTSDTDSANMNSYFNSNASFTVSPYLSQYMQIAYDEIKSDIKKFTLGSVVKTVTIDPPPSIAKRASLGVALTQQLAYIRGPEYISDIGDLAPKYLNEFDIATADRLRRLKLGDDRDGYINTNLTDLNIGKKGLLQYVDLTNLSQLTRDPRIDECDKLATLKLLGTNMSVVGMPKGSILTTVYLPATITNLSFERPLKLANLLTVKPSHRDDGNDPEGLFVEDLTDRLPAFEASGVLGDGTQIGRFNFDDTQLGYHTYRMLNYLFTLKRAVQTQTISKTYTQNGTSRTTAAKLEIQLKNVNWSPYTKLTLEDAYLGSRANDYFIRNYITYSPYTYTTLEQYTRDVKSGNLYLLDRTRQISPVKNLDLFRHLCERYDDPNVTIGAGNENEYFFCPLVIDGTQKVMPTITGSMHISNTEQTKVNEAEIFSYYQRLDHFPKLDITADYIEPANRARFIEYLPDGSVHEFGTQKYAAGVSGLSPNVYYDTNKWDIPSRLHYDFVGWVLASASSIDWANNGSVNNNWMIDNHTDTSTPAQRTTYVIDENNISSPNNLLSYTLAGDNIEYTFVAVYAVHGYRITYHLDNGTGFYTTNPITGEEDVLVTSVAISGQPVEFTALTPWKDDSALDVYETYKFKGWALEINPGDTSVLYNNTTRRLTVDRDTDVYAKFNRESVYANPLTADDLEIRRVDGSNDSVKITIKVDRRFRGKICLPSTVQYSFDPQVAATTWKVVGLLGSAIEGHDVIRDITDGDDTDGGNLSYQPTLTHIFFAGCEDANTGTHKGTIDYIEEFPRYGFYRDTNLVYIDIPESLSIIGGNALQACPNLSPVYVSDFKNVYSFGIAGFYDSWSNAEPHTLTLRLSARIFERIGGIGSNCFNTFQTEFPLERVYIGSSSNPITEINNRLGSNSFHGGLTEIVAYYDMNANQPIDEETLRQFIYNSISADQGDPENVAITLIPC